MRSSVRSLLQSFPPGFALMLAVYQLLPGETLSLKKGLVLVVAFLIGIIGALFCGRILRTRFAIPRKKLAADFLLSLIFAVSFTAIFHLSLPQKEILLETHRIAIQVRDVYLSETATGIRFLSMNNGYRGIAFADFRIAGSWERRADQLILLENNPETEIVFQGKTGQTVDLFFLAGEEAGAVEINWGDGAVETVDLSRTAEEPYSLMVRHHYGSSAAFMERLNFFFNLLSVVIPLTCLIFFYLLVLQKLLSRRSRQFATLFTVLSLCTVFIRVVNVYNFPLGWDEGTYSRAALRYSEKALNFKWQEIPSIVYNHEHPAFVKLMFAIPATLDGREAFARFGWNRLNNAGLGKEDYTIFTARLVSAIFSLWLVQTAAYLIHPLTGFFLMIHSLAAEYGAQARLEAIPMLFSFLSIWFFSKFLADWQAQQRWKANRRLILSAIFLGLTAASKVIYCVIVFAMLFMALESLIRDNSRWKQWLLTMITFGIISLASFYVFNPSLWYQPAERLKMMLSFHDHYQETVGNIYPFWQPIVWVTRSVAHQPGHFAEKSLLAKAPEHFFFSCDELIFLLACLGAAPLFRKQRIYIVWFIIGMIFLFLWGTKWEQYACVVVVPICIAATHGTLRLARRLATGS